MLMKRHSKLIHSKASPIPPVNKEDFNLVEFLGEIEAAQAIHVSMEYLQEHLLVLSQELILEKWRT